MTSRSRLSETRSLGIGAGVVLAFLALLEATRRLELGPGLFGDRPVVVAVAVVVVAAFAVTWVVTDSAFES